MRCVHVRACREKKEQAGITFSYAAVQWEKR
jgi:hypothetical protein